MRKDEYERNKPIVWALFANGVLSGRADNGTACTQADKMLAEFEKRFVEKDGEE